MITFSGRKNARRWDRRETSVATTIIASEIGVMRTSLVQMDRAHPAYARTFLISHISLSHPDQSIRPA
jgi:hypothetical protein